MLIGLIKKFDVLLQFQNEENISIYEAITICNFQPINQSTIELAMVWRPALFYSISKNPSQERICDKRKFIVLFLET